MKAYRKQIDAAKAPKQTKEPQATPAPETEHKTISKSQDARIHFMRGIVANARVRG